MIKVPDDECVVERMVTTALTLLLAGGRATAAPNASRLRHAAADDMGVAIASSCRSSARRIPWPRTCRQDRTS